VPDPPDFQIAISIRSTFDSILHCQNVPLMPILHFAHNVFIYICRHMHPFLETLITIKYFLSHQQNLCFFCPKWLHRAVNRTLTQTLLLPQSLISRFDSRLWCAKGRFSETVPFHIPSPKEYFKQKSLMLNILHPKTNKLLPFNFRSPELNAFKNTSLQHLWRLILPSYAP